MPTRYEEVSGPSRRQKYETEQLEAALRDAKSGKLSLRSAVRKYSDEFLVRRKRHLNVFRHDSPGDYWVLGFLKRHRNLVHRFGA